VTTSVVITSSLSAATAAATTGCAIKIPRFGQKPKVSEKCVHQ